MRRLDRPAQREERPSPRLGRTLAAGLGTAGLLGVLGVGLATDQNRAIADAAILDAAILDADVVDAGSDVADAAVLDVAVVDAAVLDADIPDVAVVDVALLHGAADEPLRADALSDYVFDPNTAAFDAAEPPIDKTSEAVLQVTSALDLAVTFETIGYSYHDVRDDGSSVPRIFVADMPADMDDLASVNERKAVFFGMLLPAMLTVNEEIEADRARLEEIAARREDGEILMLEDLNFVTYLAEDYAVNLGDPVVMDEVLADLLLRVDVVPPSMALAQAAVESGWGRSALATNANALFGMITTRGDGVPSRDGRQYAAYESLFDSVEAYVHNLNYHRAYDDFRELRAEQRAAGLTPDGYHLIEGLDAYSELGDEYIAYIRRVIRFNELQALDDARLAPGTPAVPTTI